LQRYMEDLEQALRGEVLAHKNDHRFAMQKHGEDNKALQHSHAKLTDLVTDFKVGLEKHMITHTDSIRDLLEQEKSDRFRHHSSLQDRIDVIQTALVKEDEDLRERLKVSLDRADRRPVGIDRAELDTEIRRLWQAVDSHTHNLVEEPGTKSPIEPQPIMPTQLEPMPLSKVSSVVIQSPSVPTGRRMSRSVLVPTAVTTVRSGSVGPH